MIATLQALVVELRATIVRLEERVRDLETRVGRNRSRGSVGNAHQVTGPATSGVA